MKKIDTSSLDLIFTFTWHDNQSQSSLIDICLFFSVVSFSFLQSLCTCIVLNNLWEDTICHYVFQKLPNLTSPIQLYQIKLSALTKCTGPVRSHRRTSLPSTGHICQISFESYLISPNILAKKINLASANSRLVVTLVSLEIKLYCLLF